MTHDKAEAHRKRWKDPYRIVSRLLGSRSPAAKGYTPKMTTIAVITEQAHRKATMF